MATATANGLMSTGEAAKALGIDAWQLVRLYERGLAEEPARFGRYRAIDPADLPALRRAAVKAGYLPDDGGRAA